MPARPRLRPRSLRPWSAHIALTQLRAGGRRPYSSSESRPFSPNDPAATGTASTQSKGARDFKDASWRISRESTPPSSDKAKDDLAIMEENLDNKRAYQSEASTLSRIRRVRVDLRPQSTQAAQDLQNVRHVRDVRYVRDVNDVRAEMAEKLARRRLKLEKSTAQADTPNESHTVEDTVRELLLPELRVLKELREAMERQKCETNQGQTPKPEIGQSMHEIEQSISRKLSNIDSFLKDRWGIELSEIAQESAASRESGTTVSDESGDVPSLMEELFPERSKKTGHQQRGEQRELPRLELPSDEPVPGQPSRNIRSRLRRRNFSNQEGLPEVILFRSASPSLTEADFRCLLPKGKHIREWSSAAGELIKVIPARDPISLEHHCAYFLLFSNIAAALAFRNRARRVHRLCKLHTPSSLMSPLPPPPGVLEGGEDIHALTRTFTLATPSQRLDLRILPKPHSARVSELLRNGGELPMVATEGCKVLLKMTGHSDLSRLKIMRIIADDGRDRGQPWGLIPGPDAVMNLRELVTELTMEGKALSSRDRASKEPSADGKAAGEDVVAREDLSGAEKVIWEKAQMRWLVAFKDEIDAKRFAAAWNGRAIYSGTYDGPEENEVPTVVHAEYLW